MKKSEFNGYVYDFRVDYGTTNVHDIVDIHKYLMKKKRHSVIKCLYLLKSVSCRINNFIKFHKRKFVELYFDEQSRM